MMHGTWKQTGGSSGGGGLGPLPVVAGVVVLAVLVAPAAGAAVGVLGHALAVALIILASCAGGVVVAVGGVWAYRMLPPRRVIVREVEARPVPQVVQRLQAEVEPPQARAIGQRPQWPDQPALYAPGRHERG